MLVNETWAAAAVSILYFRGAEFIIRRIWSEMDEAEQEEDRQLLEQQRDELRAREEEDAAFSAAFRRYLRSDEEEVQEVAQENVGSEEDLELVAQRPAIQAPLLTLAVPVTTLAIVPHAGHYASDPTIKAVKDLQLAFLRRKFEEMRKQAEENRMEAQEYQQKAKESSLLARKNEQRRKEEHRQAGEFRRSRDQALHDAGKLQEDLDTAEKARDDAVNKNSQLSSELEEQSAKLARAQAEGNWWLEESTRSSKRAVQAAEDAKWKKRAAENELSMARKARADARKTLEEARNFERPTTQPELEKQASALQVKFDAEAKQAKRDADRQRNQLQRAHNGRLQQLKDDFERMTLEMKQENERLAAETSTQRQQHQALIETVELERGEARRLQQEAEEQAKQKKMAFDRQVNETKEAHDAEAKAALEKIGELQATATQAGLHLDEATQRQTNAESALTDVMNTNTHLNNQLMMEREETSRRGETIEALRAELDALRQQQQQQQQEQTIPSNEDVSAGPSASVMPTRSLGGIEDEIKQPDEQEQQQQQQHQTIPAAEQVLATPPAAPMTAPLLDGLENQTFPMNLDDVDNSLPPVPGDLFNHFPPPATVEDDFGLADIPPVMDDLQMQDGGNQAPYDQSQDNSMAWLYDATGDQTMADENPTSAPQEFDPDDEFANMMRDLDEMEQMTFPLQDEHVQDEENVQMQDQENVQMQDEATEPAAFDDLVMTNDEPYWTSSGADTAQNASVYPSNPTNFEASQQASPYALPSRENNSPYFGLPAQQAPVESLQATKSGMSAQLPLPGLFQPQLLVTGPVPGTPPPSSSNPGFFSGAQDNSSQTQPFTSSWAATGTPQPQQLDFDFGTTAPPQFTFGQGSTGKYHNSTPAAEQPIPIDPALTGDAEPEPEKDLEEALWDALNEEAEQVYGSAQSDDHGGPQVMDTGMSSQADIALLDQAMAAHAAGSLNTFQPTPPAAASADVPAATPHAPVDPSRVADAPVMPQYVPITPFQPQGQAPTTFPQASPAQPNYISPTAPRYGSTPPTIATPFQGDSSSSSRRQPLPAQPNIWNGDVTSDEKFEEATPATAAQMAARRVKPRPTRWSPGLSHARTQNAASSTPDPFRNPASQYTTLAPTPGTMNNDIAFPSPAFTANTPGSDGLDGLDVIGDDIGDIAKDLKEEESTAKGSTGTP